MNRSQSELLVLLERIFADDYIEPSERVELRTFAAQHQLAPAQVIEVVMAFVAATWGEVIADGVVTEAERRRLAALVDGLHLPDESLPPEVRRALGD